MDDFRHVVEIGGMNAIKSLVEAGCGITFLYEAAVRRELDKGTLREIELKDFNMIHDFEFIWNKGSVFSDHYRRICEIIQVSIATIILTKFKLLQECDDDLLARAICNELNHLNGVLFIDKIVPDSTIGNHNERNLRVQ